MNPGHRQPLLWQSQRVRTLKRAGALSAAHERALVGRYGDRGTSFVLDLPDLLETLRRRWSLQIGQPLSDATSQAASFYAWADLGQPQILKVYLDAGAFDRDRIALQHWRGRGAPLLAADAADIPALLIERVDGIPMTGTPEQRGEAARLAEMLKLLHERPAGQLPLPDVEDHLLKRFLRVERQIGAAIDHLPLGSRQIVQAQVTLDALSDNCAGADQVVLHGAMTPANVLAVTGNGFKAVSPRPLRGELSYDVACWALARAPEPLTDVKWRVGELSAALGINSERVFMWAQVLAVVETLERHIRGLGDDRELGLAAAFTGSS